MISSEYYYICHYCIDYKTINLSDMIRHFKRKNKCKCNTLSSFEEAIVLSKKKKYKFNIDISNLSSDDIIYIITHYNEQTNIIDKNFRNNTLNNNLMNNNLNNNNLTNNNLINNNLTNNNLNNIKNSNSLLSLINNTDINDILNIINQFKSQNNNIENNKKENDIEMSKKENNDVSNHLIPIKIDGYVHKDIYDNIYQNTENNHYYCGNCNTEYANINSMRRHLLSNVCIRKQEAAIIFKKNKEQCNKIIEKENKKQETINQQINYNNCNIQNNNNNNTNNSTYNLNVRDFVHDRYDVSHIKDDFYLQKDFFLYHNFLRAIMENKNNQNIFFSNDEAIIYTDNELNKMSYDKAGYFILDKLSQSFDQIFYKNDKETQEHYKFIQKYYYLVKGQYINDTIFKDYDINEQKFIYTSNSRLFRSRDKYLAKMISTLSPIKNEVRERMSVSLDQINDIPIVNPNIENYASIKMRYRDLKNKD